MEPEVEIHWVWSVMLCLFPFSSLWLFFLDGPGEWRYRGGYAFIQDAGAFQLIGLFIIAFGFTEAIYLPQTHLRDRSLIAATAFAGSCAGMLMWILAGMM
jgi:hypothetical protein